MAYEITWHQPDRVLMMKLSGEIPPAELAQMEAEAFQLVSNASNVIHAIIDMRDIGGNTGSLTSSLGSMRREKHPNQGMSLIILSNMNRIGKFVTSVAMQALRLQFRLCESLEEAEQIITKLKN